MEAKSQEAKISGVYTCGLALCQDESPLWLPASNGFMSIQAMPACLPCSGFLSTLEPMLKLFASLPSSHALREMLCMMRAAASTAVSLHPESVLNAELAPSPPTLATESALLESGSSRAIAMALLLVADSNALVSGSTGVAPYENEFSTDGIHLRAFLRAVYSY